MSSKTNFIIPNFDKSINDKINDAIEVTSPTSICRSSDNGEYRTAISTDGIPSNTDGVYVVATKIHEAKSGEFTVGFTDTKTFDSKRSGYAGLGDFLGVSLYCYYGCFDPGDVRYLSWHITKKAKEIISIFTISNNGKKEIQWIVDGNEGPVHDVTKHFGNGDEIFACISFGEEGQQLEFVSFDQAKSRSPKIEELMKEFNNKNKQQQPISAAPSTSTAENDVLIAQLREQVARSQDAAVKDRDEMIRALKQQLIAKEQHHRTDLEAKDKQIVAKDQQVERIVQSHRTDLALKDKQLTANDQQHRTDLLTKDKQLQTIVESKDQQLERIVQSHRSDLEVKDKQLTAKDQQLERIVQSHRNDLEVKDNRLELERAEHQKTRNLLHQIKMELKDVEIFYLNREKESGQRRQREEANDHFKVKQEPGLE